MNFYSINNSNFQSTIFEKSSIPITWLSQAMIKISKDYPNLNDIAKHTLIFVESPVRIISSTNVAKQYKLDKNTLIAVVPFNTEFFIENGENKKTIISNNISLKSIDTLQKPELDMSETMTEQEILALNWLKQESTGTSSKTMCFQIFPKIKTYFEANSTSNFYFEPDVPYDNGDFNRCVKFAKYVQILPEQLAQVAQINSKWEKIISQWDNLVALISTNSEENFKKSYSIIKECISNNNKLKM